ncbi:copper transporter [Salinibacterium sp. dk2585]|uniref:cytochrome c oxidase assembly protein n=1 Tax=unclassified Salinibacterium TaxID=2632331 RepID=UPI0011C24FAE|nr:MULTISPECIES: cytochrome c oxidase assembly protein [unclassified Salinibacterium]QEE60166.1 copper transporter [Salinibacterium sp. dk2585]TXK55238.1 bifunctional copper resistance protein CopD/cytochrome c oxidase assembly protein [Salinibacterium sp. dk5596]
MIRLVRVAGPAVLLVVALIATFASLAFGGGADAQALADPGELVRYGLPVAKLLVNLGAATAIGALVLASFALSRDEPAWGTAIDVAAAGAAVWTVAAAATAFLTFLSIYQQPVSADPEFGRLLGQFVTETELGIAWLVTTLIAAAVTALAFAVRPPTAVAVTAALAGAGLVPMATQGHAAGTAGHATAVNALGLHLVFAALWLGGLLTLVMLQRTLKGERLVTVLERYSTIALLSFIVVAISGYVSAALRVGEFDALMTPYGILVIVKVLALLALGVFGALYRRSVIRRMAASDKARGWFWWLVVAELGFMGIASGVASALARTATPVQEEYLDSTPALILTGEPLPPPVTAMSFLTEWRFDPLWTLIPVFLAFFYLAGVWRLHKRGDRWPVLRTVSWLAGLALLFYVTNGALNVYERYLFSMHMMGHMLLGMMIPVLLVPGAPVTLASRAIRKRNDGSRGVREWILWAVHSRYAAVLANPIVAAVIFVGSLWLFYYSPLFRWAAEDHLGHQWMIVHFLLSGYIFVMALIGVDPVPYKAPYPLRLILLLGTMAFHAFFGLSIMMGEGLLLADWYGAMGWGTDALEDQRVGGGIAWSVGEIPTIILAITVAISWSRSDAKLTKRLDRRADRDGDTELDAYNAMLAKAAARDDAGKR